MATRSDLPGSLDERGLLPLDTARSAFTWLVTGPDPVSVEGRLFPGLPHRPVPLNELRERLLRRRCGQATRDAVWAHLVLRSRTEGATWTLGCVGVALPALITIVATLTARFAGDPSDIHAAVLTGFVTELARVDLRKPRVMLRLRWACGCRTGHPRHATWAYSCINPPSRSRRRRRSWDGDAGGGSDLSGDAWCRARCGRWSLKCATYSVSTAKRWRRLMISIRSSSSRRAVPIHRSAIAFA
jgi:hypothetical protein